jgi:hypothetical protein
VDQVHVVSRPSARGFPELSDLVKVQSLSKSEDPCSWNKE